MAKKLREENNEVVYPQVRNWLSYNQLKTASDFETPTGVSMCVPDQVMSIRDIYTRFVTGRPVDAANYGAEYFGEDEMPHLKKLDLVEIAEMLENVRENRTLLQAQHDEEVRILNELEAEKSAKQKLADAKVLIEEYENRKKAQA